MTELLSETGFLCPHAMRVALYRRGKAARLLLVFAAAIEESGTPAALGTLTVFRRIQLPLVPPRLASAMLVFAPASRELVASIVLVPAVMQTIATFIWRQFEQGSIGPGMAMALVTIILTTLTPLFFLSLLRRSGLVAE